MTDLIKRDDALALVEQWFATDNHLYSIILNDITNLPAIDPAAIREAALREAANLAWSEEEDRPWESWGEYRNIATAQTVAKEIRDAILALIGEKK